MAKTIEIKDLISLYEKEGIINNKLNLRKKELNEYLNNIDKYKVKNLELKNNHLTLQRGGKVLEERVKKHKIWVNYLYFLHKILIHFLVFVIFVILIFKIINK